MTVLPIILRKMVALLPRGPGLVGGSGSAGTCAGGAGEAAGSDASVRLGRRFGLPWFVSVVVKSRRLLAVVLIASFVLQLSALVSPLLFQVAVGKGLVHRGFSTLDVLVVGLLCVSVFRSLPGTQRRSRRDGGASSPISSPHSNATPMKG